jgi:hypothetical protein
MRYFLLKDHQSLTLIDVKTCKACVIAHSEIDRSFSSKGSVPGLNSLLIAPSTRIEAAELGGEIQIFSCESGWKVRRIKYKDNPISGDTIESAE